MAEAPPSPPETAKKPPKIRRRIVNLDRNFDQVVEPKDGKLFRRQWVDPLPGQESPLGPEEKVPVDRQMTDCLLDVECVTDKDGERTLKLVVTRGGNVSSWPLDLRSLERRDLINSWASRAGSCWNLDNDEMWALKKYLRAQPGWDRIVYQPSYTGFVQEHGVWLTANIAIDARGRPHTYVNGSPTGALVCKDGQSREFHMPKFSTHTPRVVAFGHPEDAAWRFELETGRRSIKRLVNALIQNYSCYAPAFLIGWNIANMVREEIINVEGAFPHTYVYGAMHTGKDTLIRYVYQAMCCENLSATKPGRTTTQAYLRNSMSSVAGVPFWINEVRNDDESQNLMGFIRSIFDNQTGGTADRNGGVREYPPRRGLLMSGQSVVGADAEMSRYILLELFKSKLWKEGKAEVEKAIPDARIGFSQIMATRNDWAPYCIHAVKYFKTVLREKFAALPPDEISEGAIILDRQIFCWAVALAGLCVALHTQLGDAMVEVGNKTRETLLDDRVIKEALLRMLSTQELSRMDGTLGQMWGTLESLHAERKIQTRWVAPHLHKQDETIGFWLDHLIIVLKREARDGRWDKRMIEAELRDCPGYVDRGVNVYYGKAGYHRSIIFDAASPSLPEWVKELARRKSTNPDDPDADDGAV